jgi:hypothetical protein
MRPPYPPPIALGIEGAPADRTHGYAERATATSIKGIIAQVDNFAAERLCEPRSCVRECP